MRPAGGIMVSFFVPWLDVETAHAINAALAVAVIEAIGKTTQVTPSLKWPNDVVFESPTGSTKKLAGMLAEVVSDSDGMHGVIVGIGLNVSWPTPADIAAAPQDLGGAAALNDVVGEEVVREELAAELLRCFDEELDRLEGAGVSAVHQRYETRSSTMGRRVRIEQSERTIECVATGLDPSGALLVQVGGSEEKIFAGDVVHLRDAERATDIDG